MCVWCLKVDFYNSSINTVLITRRKLRFSVLKRPGTPPSPRRNGCSASHYTITEHNQFSTYGAFEHYFWIRKTRFTTIVNWNQHSKSAAFFSLCPGISIFSWSIFWPSRYCRCWGFWFIWCYVGYEVLFHQKSPPERRRLMLKYAFGSAWNGQFLRTWIHWRHQTLLVIGQVNPAKNNGWFRFAFYWLLLCLRCSSIERIFDFWRFQWQNDFRKTLMSEKNATVGDQEVTVIYNESFRSVSLSY